MSRLGQNRARYLPIAMVAAAVCVAWLGEPDLAKARVHAGADDYQLKARFLAMAPNFVEWPQEVAARWPNEFRICVFGSFHFGIELSEETRASTVKGRKVTVQWIRQQGDLRSCQIVFVSGSEAKRYPTVLAAVQGTGSLTVGETPDFLDAGGMVTLSSRSGSLDIQVNLEAAERAQVKISSRLLAVAHRVVGGPGSGSG